MPYIIGAVFWLIAFVCLVPHANSGFVFDARHISGIVFAALPLFFWNRYVFGTVMVVIVWAFGAFAIYQGLRNCTLAGSIAFVIGLALFVAYFWLGERLFPREPTVVAVLIATFVVSTAVAFLQSSSLLFVPLGFLFCYAGYTWALCLATNRKTPSEAYAYLKDRFRQP